MRTRVQTPINLSYCSKRLGESRTGIIERIEPNIKDRIYSSFVIRGSYKLIKVNVEKERKRKNRKKTTSPNTKPRLRSVLITRSVVEETMQMKILCSDDPASPFLPPPPPPSLFSSRSNWIRNTSSGWFLRVSRSITPSLIRCKRCQPRPRPKTSSATGTGATKSRLHLSLGMVRARPRTHAI